MQNNIAIFIDEREADYWSPAIQKFLFSFGYSWFLKDMQIRDLTHPRITIRPSIKEIRNDSSTYKIAFKIPEDIAELRAELEIIRATLHLDPIDSTNITDLVYCYRPLIMHDGGLIEARVGQLYRVLFKTLEDFVFENEHGDDHSIEYNKNPYFRNAFNWEIHKWQKK